MRLIEHLEISRIEVWPDVDSLAVAAARFILESVTENPQAHITYATGDTMIPVYRELQRVASKEAASFSRSWGSHLDEYWPAHPTRHSFSFVGYLRQRVFTPLHITNVYEIDGMALDPEAEALRYEELLLKNPVSLAILGIGPGCHIGFNERGTVMTTRTHFAHLSEATISRDHGERRLSTPEDVITQGPANIFEAGHILMVAYNPVKGEYLREALSGPVTPSCPASGLRTVGEKVTIIIDEAAAAAVLEC